MRAMILLAGLLCGCSTPPVVLEQSQHGAALVREFHAQLAALHGINTAIESARREMVLDEIKQFVKHDEAQLLTDQVNIIAGTDAQLRLVRRLLDAADARSVARAKSAVERQRAQQALTPAESAYAPLDRQLKASSAAFEALGTELTREERLAVARHFARDIAQEIDQARQAALKAQAEAVKRKLNQ